MWPFTKKIEVRADTEQWADVETETKEGQLLRAALTSEDSISIDKALQIPAVAGCVNLIANTVSMVPFRLYRVNEKTKKLEEVPDDPRVAMLNTDPRDTLDAVQFKRALVRDYLLDKGGYAYIEKTGNRVKSLRYVETDHVSFNWNADPIFKDYTILVNGGTYQPFQFLKILRNTKDGYKGVGIVEENRAPLAVAYGILKYQGKLMKTGGVKKGFVKSQTRLTDVAIKALKDAWARLFSSESEENVVILNNGLDFQEASETSTDMQINETVGTNAKQICEIFNVPPAMLNREIGSASEEDRLVFIQYCITPILSAVENALNRDLLLESEKGRLKWAADTSEFTKADVLKRYQAYEIASKNGFMQIDEVRFKENLEPLGLDFVKLGLQDVLYYPDKDGMTFVPNMNQVGGIKLAMEDREDAKKQKEAEIEALKNPSELEPEPEAPEQEPEQDPEQEAPEEEPNPEGGEDDADRDQE